jgi:D-alanyl-D-alanine carboxypeptidase/D-alanyl-D-alanine-endopeptidase (penicillin-binding protein 4)
MACSDRPAMSGARVRCSRRAHRLCPHLDPGPGPAISIARARIVGREFERSRMFLRRLARCLMPVRHGLAGGLAALVLAGSVLTVPTVRAEMPAPLRQRLAAAGVPAASLGLVVAPAAGGEPFVAHQAERALQPASTMKLVTTLVALEQLGPAWRGRTRLLASAAPEHGVLHGDLVLQGQGDVDLDVDALRSLLQRARARGLVEVRGALVLDRSAFAPARTDLGAPPFDDAPEFGYNVIPDALLVADNLLHLQLFVDERGLQVVPLTPLAGLRVTHAMQLVDGDCSRWDDGWQAPQLRPEGWLRKRELVLRGSWPVRCERTLALNVLDRDEYIGRLVRRLWRELGGQWRGEVREGAAPPQALLLAEHASRPLSELVRAINKPSDNVLSRTLYLSLGRAWRAPQGSGEATLQRAEQAVRAWFGAQGIDDRGLVLDNGSGLSRRERITPSQLAAVVRAGVASRWAPEFLASLPIAGIDGTLRRRLVDGAASGQARLKTGTLRNVVALAGTMHDAAGQALVVVAMFNDDEARPAVLRPLADALAEWVARQHFAAR